MSFRTQGVHEQARQLLTRSFISIHTLGVIMFWRTQNSKAFSTIRFIIFYLVLFYFTTQFYVQSDTMDYIQEVSNTISNVIIPFFGIIVITVL